MPTTMIRDSDTSSSRGSSDLLGQAADYLHRASRIPYYANDPGRWLHEFQHCVSNARRLLAARSADLRVKHPERPPRLGPLARQQAAAHEHVARLADELFTNSYLVIAPDLLQMVELTEAAKVLEQAVLRQREHRSDLLFEATHRDIGGG